MFDEEGLDQTLRGHRATKKKRNQSSASEVDRIDEQPAQRQRIESPRAPVSSESTSAGGPTGGTIPAATTTNSTAQVATTVSRAPVQVATSQGNSYALTTSGNATPRTGIPTSSPASQPNIAPTLANPSGFGIGRHTVPLAAALPLASRSHAFVIPPGAFPFVSAPVSSGILPPQATVQSAPPTTPQPLASQGSQATRNSESRSGASSQAGDTPPVNDPPESNPGESSGRQRGRTKKKPQNKTARSSGSSSESKQDKTSELPVELVQEVLQVSRALLLWFSAFQCSRMSWWLGGTWQPPSWEAETNLLYLPDQGLSRR